MGINSDGSWGPLEGLRGLLYLIMGLWCEQAKHLIDSMLEHGFPNEKILYYRSGFQGWKLLGLTTVVHKEIRR